MNVTEAVDSLSAMFQPSAQLNLTSFHITLESQFLHLTHLLFREQELREAPHFTKLHIHTGKSIQVLLSSNKQHKLESFKVDQNSILSCDLFF